MQLLDGPGCLNSELLTLKPWELCAPNRLLQMHMPGTQPFLAHGVFLDHVAHKLSLSDAWRLQAERQRSLPSSREDAVAFAMPTKLSGLAEHAEPSHHKQLRPACGELTVSLSCSLATAPPTSPRTPWRRSKLADVAGVLLWVCYLRLCMCVCLLASVLVDSAMARQTAVSARPQMFVSALHSLPLPDLLTLTSSRSSRCSQEQRLRKSAPCLSSVLGRLAELSLENPVLAEWTRGYSVDLLGITSEAHLPSLHKDLHVAPQVA